MNRVDSVKLKCYFTVLMRNVVVIKTNLKCVSGVHTQSSRAATGKRSRKEWPFPRQSQQPGEESRGRGFASGTQPPALCRRGVRDEQVDPGALTRPRAHQASAGLTSNKDITRNYNSSNLT